MHTNLVYQLYAAIREWHKGTCKSIEFSASTYINVYNGHISKIVRQTHGLVDLALGT